MKFQDVEYKVKNRNSSSEINPVKAVVSKVGSHHDKYKEILKGITGSTAPAEILALMGPSGSGKTTLLKILGGRLTDNVKGNITYNDIPHNAAVKRRLIVKEKKNEEIFFPFLQLNLNGNLISGLDLSHKMTYYSHN